MRLRQSENASSPIYVTLAGISMLVSAAIIPSNACDDIAVRRDRRDYYVGVGASADAADVACAVAVRREFKTFTVNELGIDNLWFGCVGLCNRFRRRLVVVGQNRICHRIRFNFYRRFGWCVRGRFAARRENYCRA